MKVLFLKKSRDYGLEIYNARARGTWLTRPTNGEIRVTPASAHATACPKPKSRVTLSEVTVDTVIMLKFASRLNTFPGRCNLNQDTFLFDTDRLVEGDQFLCLKPERVSIKVMPRRNPRTLAFVASLSNESRASTSVETRPGMIARISLPNSTSW
jgi:hypothetical protein